MSVFNWIDDGIMFLIRDSLVSSMQTSTTEPRGTIRPLSAFVWAGILLGLNSPGCTAANTKPAQSMKIRGQVTANEVNDRLESVGIKTVLQEGEPSRLVITKVRMGSAAYYKGVSEGDRVLSVEPAGPGFNLTFERSGSRYQIFLHQQPKRPDPEQSLASSEADKYLQSLEADILKVQNTRTKAAADEAAAPERAKKAEKEAMKNESTAKIGDRVVSAEDIAKTDGSTIRQSHYPNCWFESCVSAIVDLPNGHELIASMMKKISDRSFRVTFPGDYKYVDVTIDDINDYGVQDKALWARILDVACLKKFPGNEGVGYETGMAILTGKKTKFVDPGHLTESELSKLLSDSIANSVPMIMGTSHQNHAGVLVSNHAYTIVAFDKNSGVVTLRNPWNGDPLFFKKPDLSHCTPIQETQGARELGNGIVQVNLGAVIHNFNGIVLAGNQ